MTGVDVRDGRGVAVRVEVAVAEGIGVKVGATVGVRVSVAVGGAPRKVNVLEACNCWPMKIRTS